jgi:hypothetical protein
MNHSTVKPKTEMVDTIANQNNMKHSSVKHYKIMVENITTTT